MKTRKSLAALALLNLAAVATAQTLVARDSGLNHNYVYGAGGDTHVGSDSVTDVAMLASDSETLLFSGSTSGFLSGMPYSASVGVDLRSDYTILGPLTGFNSILAQATSMVTASASGLGTSVMRSDNPGNHLQLNFDVTSSTFFKLSGNLTTPFATAGAGSFVAIQRFDSIVWQNVFITYSLPGQQGPFSLGGVLIPGNYRILANLGIAAGANQSWTSSYDYAFEIGTFVQPTSYTILQGLNFGGNLASLLNSDDDKVFVLCDELDSNGEIQFDSTLPAGTVNQLKFKFEGSASRTDLSQFVRMFNYLTNTYTNVSFQNTTLVDSVVEGTITSVAASYYSGTRAVKSRVFWVPQVDIDAADGWIQSCDQVLWTMN